MFGRQKPSQATPSSAASGSAPPTPSPAQATPNSLSAISASPGPIIITFIDPYGTKKPVKKEVIHPFFYALAEMVENEDSLVWTIFIEASVGKFPKDYTYFPPGPGAHHRLTYRRRKRTFTCELSADPADRSKMVTTVSQFIYETSGNGSSTDIKAESEPEVVTWASIASKPRIVSQYIEAMVGRKTDELKLTRLEIRDLWREVDRLRMADLVKPWHVIFRDGQLVDIPAISFCPKSRAFAADLSGRAVE